MFGLVVFALYSGFALLKYNVDPMTTLSNYALTLYNWHLYSSIVIQAIFFFTTFVFFVLFIVCKHDSEKRSQISRQIGTLLGRGYLHFIASIGFIFGSAFLVSLGNVHAVNVVNLPANLVFMTILMYGVGMWMTLAMTRVKSRNSDKKVVDKK